MDNLNIGHTQNIIRKTYLKNQELFIKTLTEHDFTRSCIKDLKVFYAQQTRLLNDLERLKELETLTYKYRTKEFVQDNENSPIIPSTY